MTPLYLTVDLRKSEKILQLLLEHNADTEARDVFFGETSLHCAIRGSQRAMMWNLLQAGASVETKNRQGETALDLARKRDIHLVEGEKKFADIEKPY